MRKKLNLIQAYQKTLTSKGIIAQLWDYLNDAELLVNAPYLFDEDNDQTLDNYYYFLPHPVDQTAPRAGR